MVRWQIPNRANATGQRQFADGDEFVEHVGLDLFAGGQHAEGDGQVETGAFFFDVGGGEVDGALAHGKLVAGTVHRGGNAFLGFLDGGIGQADEHDEGLAVAAIDLDLDGVGVDTRDGGGQNP